MEGLYFTLGTGFPQLPGDWLPKQVSAHTPYQLPPPYRAKSKLHNERNSYRCFSTGDISNISQFVNMYLKTDLINLYQNSYSV